METTCVQRRLKQRDGEQGEGRNVEGSEEKQSVVSSDDRERKKQTAISWGLLFLIFSKNGKGGAKSEDRGSEIEDEARGKRSNSWFSYGFRDGVKVGREY